MRKRREIHEQKKGISIGANQLDYFLAVHGWLSLVLWSWCLLSCIVTSCLYANVGLAQFLWNGCCNSVLKWLHFCQLFTRKDYLELINCILFPSFLTSLREHECPWHQRKIKLTLFYCAHKCLLNFCERRALLFSQGHINWKFASFSFLFCPYSVESTNFL